MIRRTIREWQRIDYGSDDATIPEPIAGRIVAVAQSSSFSGRGGDGVLEHGRKSLRARGIVGVIATAGCQLEILPKIDGIGDTDVTDKTLRHRLIHMLAVAYDLPIDTLGVTHLGVQNDTVLELLIRLFCTKLTDAVRHGMPRQYIEQEDDLPALRGRLNVTRQFSALAVSPQKLACRFDALSPDIALNQVMRATVSLLSKISLASDNQRNLRELNLVYADVQMIPVGALRWDKIILNRSNGRWKDLLGLAELFLTRRHQNTNAGATDGHALLFEMNILFERYIARLLPRALARTGLRISTQGGHKSCLYDGEKAIFRTRPDIVIRRDQDIVLIVDTKWKRIAPMVEDPKQGISQSDVYQLMAYSQLYDCPKVMLLYPHHAGLPAFPVKQRYAIKHSAAQESLLLASIDVTGTRKHHLDALSVLILDQMADL